MIFFVVILLSLCVGLLFLFYKKTFAHWKREGLQYLQPSIPFGNVKGLYKGEESFGELFYNLFSQIKRRGWKHGGVYFFWNPIYIPTDPVIIKDIMISSFDQFRNHGFYISKEDPLTQHLFNLEDTKWRDVRAKLSHCFTSGKMRGMFQVMTKHSEILKTVLDEELSNNQPVNVKNLFIRYTADVVSSCTMGIETNLLKDSDAEILKHGRNFFDKSWSKLNNTITFIVPREILKMCNFKITLPESESFFLNLFRSIRGYREKSKEKRNDLFDVLLKLADPSYTKKINDFTGKQSMESMTFGETVAQSYVFFVTGFETSSTTMSFALYELAKNPECQKKLREEINAVLEKHNNEITYDAVQEIEYLDMVVKETLRLYPALPIIPRVCNKDYKVPGTDFVLKSNSPVIISNMGIHRDPEHWPSPDKFDPERFSLKNREKIAPYTYIPFGDGPRLCIAHRFGQLQSKIGLITAIRNYEIELNQKTIQPFKFCTKSLVLTAKGGIWLDFKKLY